MKYYTGIGSREINYEVKYMMQRFAFIMYCHDYTLRSGGAIGADSAFESYACEKKEIYLPWKGFNEHDSDLYVKNFSKEIQEEQKEYGRKHHPVFDSLKYGAQCMMRRNAHQVLGKDLKTPSDFVVCWTKNGKDIGGTGFAIRLAWSKKHSSLQSF